MTIDPCGSMCILPDPANHEWIVTLCEAASGRKELRRFPTREDAVSFAVIERDRVRKESGREITLQLPDDCPCYRDLK